MHDLAYAARYAQPTKDQREIYIQEYQPMRKGLHPQLELRVFPTGNPDKYSCEKEITFHRRNFKIKYQTYWNNICH
jgi:hypothetical protein